MQTRNHSERKSDLEFFKAARKVNNKMIYIAITVILVVTAIAMTGVYFEYW